MKILLYAAMCAAVILGGSASEGATVNKILYSFANSGKMGKLPYGRVLLDGPDSLYGTASDGGTKHAGTVFKLTRPKSGTGPWTTTVLASFGFLDGGQPAGDLVKGPDGTLYGATIGGGTYTYGTIYKLVPPAGSVKVWTKTILHEFTGGVDGGIAATSLILGPDGTLYGTTREGGTNSCGVVFKLTRPTSGTGPWTERVLHQFKCGTDGAYPSQGVVLLPNGRLFGTTTEGGTYGYGTVFALTPPSVPSGNWTKSTIYMFGNGTDGRKPFSSLVQGPDGVFYGTTLTGGRHDLGTVFALYPPTKTRASWYEAVLHDFKGGTDGAAPIGGVVRAPNGTLYGTTISGGGYGLGSVFQVKPPTATNPNWAEKVLLPFTPGGSGVAPEAGLVLDATGILYGTTMSGGANGYGTVFSVTP